MKKLTVHIGYAKSGTSSIQTLLAENPDVLNAHGILYPKTGRPILKGGNRAFNHTGFTDLFLQKSPPSQDLSQLKQQFDAECEGADHILVSCEAFANISDMRVFLDFFEGYDITAILYARENADAAISLYRSLVLSGSLYCSIEHFLQTVSANLKQVKPRWENAVGNFIIRPFSRIHFADGDLVSDFMQLIDLPKNAMPAAERQNESVAGNLLAFKIMFNQFGTHVGPMSKELRDLAKTDARFQGDFYIHDSHLDHMRTRLHVWHNEILDQLVPDLPRKSFQNAPPAFDPATWQDDFELAMCLPSFAPFRNHQPFSAMLNRNGQPSAS